VAYVSWLGIGLGFPLVQVVAAMGWVSVDSSSNIRGGVASIMSAISWGVVASVAAVMIAISWLCVSLGFPLVQVMSRVSVDGPSAVGGATVGVVGHSTMAMITG